MVAASSSPPPPPRSESWARVRKFLAGYCSGMCLVLAGHPFDTIKVRMQSEGTKGRFTGVTDCIRQTLRHEGVRGLYKGMATPLLMTGLINSVLFGTQYNLVAEIVRRREGPGAHLSSEDLHRSATISETCLAAVFSGAFISILVAPMEGIKARLQVQYSAAAPQLGAVRIGYLGPWDCARRVYGTLGLRRGLYRGWVPVCLCRMSNYAYFGSYAYISAMLAEWVHGEDFKGKPLPLSAAILAGGLTGFCYWLSCYPMDVIKNRIQAAPDSRVPLYRNWRHAAQHIRRTDGWRGFAVGFVPCVLRAFPANAAAFLGFELAMRLLPE